MSFDFIILGSSSSGNASLLRTANTKILIDAGFTAKKLLGLLEAQGESLESIDAIFITHEHTDHIAGIQGLSKYPHVQLFANRQTAASIQERVNRKLHWNIFETDSIFHFQELEIQSFSIPHDASDPVGYIFKNLAANNEDTIQSLAWVTDLGHAPPGIHEKIQKVDVLVLESNYEPELLDKDTLRPWSVKQRIRGRHGHLSNQDAYQLLASIPNPAWKQVYLAHLSQHCNTPERVKNLFSTLQTVQNQFQITVIDPMSTTATTLLRSRTTTPSKQQEVAYGVNYSY